MNSLWGGRPRLRRAIGPAWISQAVGGRRMRRPQTTGPLANLTVSISDALHWKHGRGWTPEVDRILHRARRRPDFGYPAALRRLGAAQLAHRDSGIFRNPVAGAGDRRGGAEYHFSGARDPAQRAA